MTVAAKKVLEAKISSSIDSNPRSLEEVNRHLGYNLLGPMVHRWLLGLHQYISYFDDDETAFLFCARAGVRIKLLYDLFLSGSGLGAAAGRQEILWVSRLAAAKGCYARAPFASGKVIADEFHHHPLSHLIECLLRNNPDRLASFDLGHVHFRAHGFNFPGWIKSSEASVLRDYLGECSQAFHDYMNSIVGGCKRVVLIDSGWQGSAQSLLATAFPEFEWKGLYFGRILTDKHDPAIVDDVIGIMFQQNRYDPRVPESAFVEHRHIIETLLEPNAPSIEEICGGEFEPIARRLIDANRNEVPTWEEDSLFLHVCEYLEAKAGDSGLAEIFAAHQASMPELARVIITPTADEARALRCKDRSADFGRDLKVPVLVDPLGNDPVDCDGRIQRALWRQGQIALEYKGAAARELQLRAAGCVDTIGYFDPVGNSISLGRAELTAELPEMPSVAIITRTKNRPLLLKRAAESVARQSYPEYSWIIVNDGGDEEDVREIIEQCAVDRRRITLVSNSKSLGMEAASNVGIRNSQGDFIVIHDDDDSWAPDFLKQTVEYLNSPAGQRYGGVITHSVYVSEEIRGHSVIEHARKPYQDWVRNVQLAEMACGNFFPPIAFVFRRAIWEDIGGYNESLPVLGDWYFNMEFLLRSDIGVIPEPLAYYHHRDRGDSRSGLYANSVIGGVSKHEEFASIARNEFIRKNTGRFPAAIAALHGYVLNDLRHKHEQISSAENRPGAAPAQPAPNHNPENDRYWAIAQANLAIAGIPPLQRLMKWRDLKGVTPEAGIAEITAVFARLGRKLPPPPDFDEEQYLKENPDVAAAVANGSMPGGFYHYITSGYQEGRHRPARKE